MRELSSRTRAITTSLTPLLALASFSCTDQDVSIKASGVYIMTSEDTEAEVQVCSGPTSTQGDEVLVVAESPIGFRRWMIEYKLEKRFDTPHELGGVPSWALTRELFDKGRSSLVVGRRPVPPEILDKAMEKILPASDPPTPPLDPLAATRA